MMELRHWYCVLAWMDTVPVLEIVARLKRNYPELSGYSDLLLEAEIRQYYRELKEAKDAN